jgi:hypothetical protein
MHGMHIMKIRDEYVIGSSSLIFLKITNHGRHIQYNSALHLMTC